jgi:ATP-dependent DNA helicase RecQ
LSFFKYTQYRTSLLISGNELQAKEGACFDQENQAILKFSKKFKGQLEDLEKRGYHLASVKVNFIVYWKAEQTEEELLIVLPELHFKKTTHPIGRINQAANVPSAT